METGRTLPRNHGFIETRHLGPAKVLDEQGSQALDRRNSQLPFKIISHRCGQGRTVITPSMYIRGQPDMLTGDHPLTAAILDRQIHHYHMV